MVVTWNTCCVIIILLFTWHVLCQFTWHDPFVLLKPTYGCNILTLPCRWLWNEMISIRLSCCFCRDWRCSNTHEDVLFPSIYWFLVLFLILFISKCTSEKSANPERFNFNSLVMMQMHLYLSYNLKPSVTCIADLAAWLYLILEKASQVV